MKKIYFVFFSLILIPLLITAQQKSVLKTQPSQKPAPAPIKASLSPQTKPSSIEKQVAAGKKGKPGIVHARRKHGPAIYGNEWINYGQHYYKIKVGQNGLYRIDSLTLARAGIPVDTIRSAHYQVFFHGQQQYIYVRTRTTYLSEKNGDYIEFYGQYNDGTEDSLAYYNIRFLPNPYFSLFTDTSTYYLTWAGNGLRIKEQTDTAFGSYGAASPYVMTSTTIAGRAYSKASPTNRAPNIELQNVTTSTPYFAGSWSADGGYTPNDPRFTQNSAWTTPNWIIYNSGVTYSLDVSNTFTGAGAPSAFLRTVVLGVDNGNCTFNIIPNNGAPTYSFIPCNTALDTPTGTNIFGAIDTTMVIPAANIPTSIRYYNNALTNTNIIAPTYIYLDYPHTLALNGDTSFVMDVPDNGSFPKTYLFFTGFYTTGPADTVRLYDFTNHRRLWAKAEGGGFKVVDSNNIIPGNGLKHCYMTSDYAVHLVSSLTPVGTNPLTGGNGNGQFTPFSGEPDSAYIIITHPSLWGGALAYKAYRSSRYNTVIANVEELYDQFGYGVRYSPLGIRNFCNYAINNWASPPSNLFLVGKGLHTHIFRSDTANWSRSQVLVPSFGDPSSDILFTNGLGNDTLLIPAIPTGRLAAPTSAEVSDYLTKVETYESAPAAFWMKKVAHFAGGDNNTDESLFANILTTNFAPIIEDTLFGARVFLFQKSTPAPISGTLTDSIISIIDSGVSIMTFFGHSGGTNWDESVDYPTDYVNYNKYPFMIADACFSGDIFQPIGHAITSVSEQWVLNPPPLGAIGFLASDYVGDVSPLEAYTQQIYNDISHRPFYRKPIGQIVQNTIASKSNFLNSFMPYTCMEVTLHCDPAIAINGQDSLPDYAVTNQSIYFTPSNVTVLLDSFNVHLIVYNYAEAIDTPVHGILNRTFPNGHVHSYPFLLKPTKYHYLYYADTVNIRMPVNDSNNMLGSGINYFTYTVDLNPNLPELTLSNNSVGNPPVPLLIMSEDIMPIWPYDYAIIPHDTVTLKASTNDPFAPQRTYIFEIDTSHSFNSPLFRSDTVTNSGGVIMVSPYANWGTTHFAGLAHPGIGGNNMMAKAPGAKGNSSKNQLNVTAKANLATSEKTAAMNPSQNNGFANKTTLENQGLKSPGKQPTIEISPGKQSNTLAVENGNISPEKLRKKHGPIRDSFRNNTVYYWRVRRDTADTTGIYSWVTTSFEYIKGKNGWGQSNFFQYDNDEIVNDNNNFINFNNPPRGWSYNLQGHTLECNTFGVEAYMSDLTGLTSTAYYIDNFLQTPSGCQVNYEIFVAVIDPLNPTVPWSTKYHPGIGHYNTVSSGCIYPDNKFIFIANDSIQMLALVKMLKDSVPANDYILAYSFMEGVFKYPGLHNANSVVGEFDSLGATLMPYHAHTPGLDTVPWIFFVQKGNRASARQVYGATSISTPPDLLGRGIRLSVLLSGNGTYGSIMTPLIGPAARYDSLSWSQHATYHPDKDSTRLNIIGVEPNGKSQTITRGILPSAASMYLSSINPTLFPYIQLELYTKDTVHNPHTPAQMDWWRVFYQPVPEIAMNPNIYTHYHADTVQYGDVLNFQTTVQNVSDWPIAGTQLLTWIQNQSNGITYYNQGQMVKPLNPGDTAKISFAFTNPPSNINSLQNVWFEINPENYPDTRLEQYHFNDYAEKSFYSYGDKINPTLDVTFNGIHILNNDIVSAQPSILISFMDENKFLALNNANNFKVYLNPVGSPLQQVSYGPTLSFTPAVLPHNKCNLLLTPALADGTYQLTVQGTDISGNLSAANSYSVDFEVINKSMITEVLNYPNPFTTSTRFVFILTGEQIPTIFKIQIMTLTGKIVKEINEDEIGPIHIGRNITQYAWDGCDQYGSKLANGVYLYRVVTSINGQGIDEYKQGYQGANIDQYFTKGWGKMYLMR